MGYALRVGEAAEQNYGSGPPGSDTFTADSPRCTADPAPIDSVDRRGIDPESAAAPDAIEELGDEIATLAAHLHAAKHRLLGLIARFEALRGWEPGGHRSCAHWLAFRAGLDLVTAREHVRVARALEHLPLIAESMSRGQLSFSQVRALTRVADVSTESDLVELAEGCTTVQLERILRGLKLGSRQDEAAWERQRHETRSLSVFPDHDGMYVINGRLDPEVGALLMRAIEAASDALYRERAHGSETASGTEPAQRRADSIGLLAERALAAGFAGLEVPDDDSDGRCCDGFRGDRADRADDDDCPDDDEMTLHVKRLPRVPISGSRAERYQVVLHVERETLTCDEEPGRSDMEDGTRVSAETSRRLSCDAGLVPVTHAPDGSVLDVGRKTRTIPPALRRALEVRDRGCRFPGCGLRFTDAHHIVHWADGGETSLENSVLLCRFHHRLVHEGGWKVEWWGRGAERAAAFRDPRGQMHAGRPRRMPDVHTGGDAVMVLARASRLHGADPDAVSAGARWRREADIPEEVLFRAIEAAL